MDAMSRFKAFKRTRSSQECSRGEIYLVIEYEEFKWRTGKCEILPMSFDWTHDRGPFHCFL